MLTSQTHMPPVQPAKRIQMTEDELIAAMKADAKEIKLRHGNPKRSVTPELPEQAILDIIKQNPGIDILELAASLGRSHTNMRTRMSSMEARGQVKVEMFKHPKSFRRTRRFFPVPNPKITKNGRPIRPAYRREEVIAFIKSNPGCTSCDIAAHMDCSTKAAAGRLSEARNFANIRSERQKGGAHLPAKHWIDE
jgi:predicted transcriptional regulator